jgi:hypothetical protein
VNSQRYKYPRTPHLPWSPGASSDDLVAGVPNTFLQADVVVTEKLDGENTTLYRDWVHARSVDSRHHPSRNWVKALQGEIGYQIPEGYRICGENMYARHSIAYEDLASYFYVFSVWDETNLCLSWTETKEWAELLGLEVVPTVYEGPWDQSQVEGLSFDTSAMEGYVVRSAAAFPFESFGEHIAKWVRTGHVQTDDHWMHKQVIANGLSEGKES